MSVSLVANASILLLIFQITFQGITSVTAQVWKDDRGEGSLLDLARRVHNRVGKKDIFGINLFNEI